MNKRTIRKMVSRITLVAALLTILAASSLTAQMRMMIEGDGEIYMLMELGAMIAEDGNKLVVQMVMPANMRPKGYGDVDIQKNDQILMLNGKRMKSVADIKSIIEELKPGDKLSFGLKRGKDMQIISFAKADPKDLPKIEMSTSFGPAGDNEGDGEITIMLGGGSEDDQSLAMLSGSGLIASDTDDGVIIAHILPHAADLLGKGTVEKNDLIVTLQGKAPTTAKELSEQYDSIKVGAKITLVISRDGKEHTITFDKPKAEASGMMMITN